METAKAEHSPLALPICLLPSLPSVAMHLNLLTYNATSLAAHSRLRELCLSTAFRSLGAGIGILFLQECRLGVTTFSTNNHSARRDFFLQHQIPVQAQSFFQQGVVSADAGIIVNQPDWQLEVSDIGERHVFLTFTSTPLSSDHSGRIHLWSVHGSFDVENWRNDAPGFSSRLHFQPQDLIIIGADWNSYPDPALDAAAQTRHPMWFRIQARLSSLPVVDGFRFFRPHAKEYSRIAMNHAPQPTLSTKRIDSIWLSTWAAPLIDGYAFRWLSSDHRAFALTLRLDPEEQIAERGPGFWRVHPGLLNDSTFRTTVTAFLQGILPRHLLILTPQQAVDLWFTFKSRLRALVYNTSLSAGRRQHSLATNVTTYERIMDSLDLTRAEHRALFPGLHRDVKAARRAADAAESLTFRRKLDAELLRPSSWLAFLTTPPSQHSLACLQKADGTSATTAEEQLSLIHDFYSDLFGRTPATPATHVARQTLLRTPAARMLSASTVALLTDPFREDELVTALSLASPDSAPGQDGLIYPIYQVAPGTVSKFLTPLVNGLMRGASLPQGFPMLRGTLLYKKGDRSQLANYRPLSIADTDTRLVGRALAARLQQFAQDCIPWSQAGFINTRRAADPASILIGLQQYMQLVGNPVTPVSRNATTPMRLPFVLPPHILVLSLDQTKAYDRVAHEWLQVALQHYGAPQPLLNLVAAMYRTPTLTFLADGHRGTPIAYQRGVLQGEPSSCLLYNISLQPFLDELVRQGVGVKLPFLQEPLTSLAFADDVLVFIHDPRQLAAFHQARQLYEQASDALLSATKSGYVILSSISSAPPPWMPACGFPPLQDQGSSEIRYLGYPLTLSTPHPVETFYRLLGSARAKLTCFTASTDLFARARIVNTFAFSRLWHSLSLSLPRHQMFQEMRILARHYLFRGNRSWVKWSTVITPKELGGLGLLDPERHIMALHGAHLARTLVREDPIGEFHRTGIRAAFNACGYSEQVFFYRGGGAHTNAGTVNHRFQSLWGYWLYVLKRLYPGLQPNCWTSLSTLETCALPWYNSAYGTLPNFQQQAHVEQRFLLGGYYTFADVLWWIDQPDYNIVSRPFSPPTASGIKYNWRPFLFRPALAHDRPFAEEPVVKGASIVRKVWNSYWPTLPHELRTILFRLGALFYPERLNALTKSSGRPFVRPLAKLEPATLPFPWRITTLANQPIQDVTVRSIRRFLSPQRPIVPDWPFNGTPTPGRYQQDLFYFREQRILWPDATLDQWQSVWTDLHSLPLTSKTLSDTFLFLHRRAYLSCTTAAALQALAEYDAASFTLDEDARFDLPEDDLPPEASSDGGAAGVAGAPHGAGSPTPSVAANAPESTTDSSLEQLDSQDPDTPRPYGPSLPPADELKFFSADPCPAQCYQVDHNGDPVKDSVQHGYIECPFVTKVWRAALPVLNDLLGTSHYAPSLTVTDIVLGWPRGLVPARHRLLLWRSAVLSFIAQSRRQAIQQAHTAKAPAVITFHLATVQPALLRILFDGLEATLAVIRSSSVGPSTFSRFRRKWLQQGRLFTLSDDGQLQFHSRPQVFASNTAFPPSGASTQTS